MTSAVDELNRRIILDALSQLKGSLTIVIVTHQLEYLDLADQVIDLAEDKEPATALAF